MKIQTALKMKTFLNQIDLNKLDYEEFKNVVNLSKNLNQEITVHYERQQKLLNNYNIYADKTGTYDWTDHKDAQTITKKVQEWTDDKLDIKPLNFLTEETFYKISREKASLDDIVALEPYLT